jgi:hypothetical protein
MTITRLGGFFSSSSDSDFGPGVTGIWMHPLWNQRRKRRPCQIRGLMPQILELRALLLSSFPPAILLVPKAL